MISPNETHDESKEVVKCVWIYDQDVAVPLKTAVSIPYTKLKSSKMLSDILDASMNAKGKYPVNIFIRQNNKLQIVQCALELIAAHDEGYDIRDLVSLVRSRMRESGVTNSEVIDLVATILRLECKSILQACLIVADELFTEG